MKLQTLTKLGQRGMSHVVLPLLVVVGLAVGGTFALVSSHAATKKADVTKGYMQIYGDSNYDSVKITRVSTDANHKCTGMTSTSNSVVKKVSTKKPIKVACTRVAGDSAYEVAYGKAGKFDTNATQAVDIDGGFCSKIHVDPALNSKTAGTCKADPKAAQAKVDAEIKVLPSYDAKTRAVTGYVSVALPGKDVERSQCTGQVVLTIAYVNPHPAPVSKTVKLPLKLAKDKKAEHTSCAAKIRAIKDKNFLKGGEAYTITANFGGNRAFNAGSASTTVTLPKTN